MNVLKVVAVIPAFNEEKTIIDVVHKTKEFVNDVIVVDDGSSDRTRVEASEAGAKVVSLPLNRGVAHAISVGLKEALKLKPDVIVQLDGDGQHNPDEIPNLLKPLEDGKADVVVGSRFLDGDDIRDMPWIKRFGNKVFSRILSQMCHTHITDSQSGFRAYKREVAEDIELISMFSYTQEFLVKAYQADYRIAEVPVKVTSRGHGKSKVVGSVPYYALNQIATLFRVYRDYKPLKTFALLSLSFFVVGFLLSMLGLVQYRHQLFLGLSSLLFVLTGLQVFFFGLLSDMRER